MKYLVVLLITMAAATDSTAQVNDPLFNAALKTLLSHDVPEVPVKEAVKRYDAVFLDAREKPEFDVSHIKGARYVGYDSFDISRVQGLKQSQPIIVYCSVGYRSEQITEKLRDYGFTDVSNLYGGIFEWVNEGYKVYDNSGKQTNKVHAYDKTWGVWLKKGEKVY
jgi:rhodanese-related sulfurtransferase